MHEFSLASALIKKIEDLKDELGFRTVKRVSVEVGAFSNVVPEFLQQAFDIAKQDSCASNAELKILGKRGKLVCDACGNEYYPEIPIALCPKCGQLFGRIEQGRELTLKELEVDDED